MFFRITKGPFIFRIKFRFLCMSFKTLQSLALTSFFFSFFFCFNQPHVLLCPDNYWITVLQPLQLPNQVCILTPCIYFKSTLGRLLRSSLSVTSVQHLPSPATACEMNLLTNTCRLAILSWGGSYQRLTVGGRWAETKEVRAQNHGQGLVKSTLEVPPTVFFKKKGELVEWRTNRSRSCSVQ